MNPSQSPSTRTAPSPNPPKRVGTPEGLSPTRAPSGTHSPLTSHQLSAASLKLFLAGKDTVEIGKSLGIPEARASKLLWVARCRARRLPADFIFNGAIRRILA